MYMCGYEQFSRHSDGQWAGRLWNWVSISRRGKRSIFPLFHSVQTGSGAHPTSYATGTLGSFFGGKAVGV
jgi:hypothetical protein